MSKKPRDSSHFRNSLISVRRSPQEPSCSAFRSLLLCVLDSFSDYACWWDGSPSSSQHVSMVQVWIYGHTRSPNKPQNETDWLWFASLELRACPWTSQWPQEKMMLGSYAKLGSHTVPGMGVVGRYCQCHKTHRDWRQRRVAPSQTLETVTGNSKWIGAGQETTHVHQEGLSPNTL